MSERLPLSQLLAEKADQEPVVPFAAFRDEIPCIVTAVLERTAAIHAVGDRYDTGAVRHDRILVDPDTVEWKVSLGARGTENGQAPPSNMAGTHRALWSRRAQPKSEADREAQRTVSDRRALENKDQVARTAEAQKKADRERALQEAADASKTVEKSEPFAPQLVVAPGLYDRHGKPLRLDPQAQAKAEELLAQQGVRIEPAVAAAAPKLQLVKKDGGPDPEDRRAWRREQHELAKTGQRRCPTCRLVKDLEKDFPKSNKGRCTPCNRTYQSDWAHEKLGSAPSREGQKRISQEESRALAEKGLKRCPKCHRDQPIDDFNTAGYCSCRFVNGQSPSPHAVKLAERRHEPREEEPRKPTPAAPRPPSWLVEPTPPGLIVTGGYPELLERLKRLRQERDDARQERDEARAELARVYADIQEALAE